MLRNVEKCGVLKISDFFGDFDITQTYTTRQEMSKNVELCQILLKSVLGGVTSG